MALLARLRRATVLSSAMCRSFCSISSTSSPHFLLPNHRSPSACFEKGKLKILSLAHSSSSFHSSIPFSFGRFDREQDNNKIPEDEILFEGCDYNHWLITMDFPKDPKPSPEEMVETYVQTLAKVVGSVEEAKKKMYACSTTTYTGFQAVMTEEMSEKFRGLPGVVFILPDSYIDPVNKEYGGDKYDNGVITPRPPPFQYRRNNNNNNNRRNTRYDPPPRYEQQRGPPMQGRDQNEYHQQMPGQGSPPNQYQGPSPGYGRQNYGPPGQEGSFGSPPGDRQQQQGFQPMYQGNPQMQQGSGGGYRPPQQGYPTMQQQQQQGYPNVQQQQGYPNVQQQQGYPNGQQQGYPTMPQQQQQQGYQQGYPIMPQQQQQRYPDRPPQPQQQRYPDMPPQQENPRTRDGADYSGQMKHDLQGHDGRGYGN